MRKLTAILTVLLALMVALPASVAASAPTCPLSGVRGKAADTLAPAETTALLNELNCALAANYNDSRARADRISAALSAGYYGTAASDASALRDQDRSQFDAFTRAATAEASATPSDVHELTLLALLHWADARDDLALTEYQSILAIQPSSVFAYLFRGSSRLYTGDDVTAQADFQQAVNLDPNNAHVYSIIGSTQQQVGNSYDALIALDYAIRLNPNDARSHYFRGMALFDNQDLRGAHDEFTLALNSDPSFVDAWYDRARVDVQLASPTEAMSDLDQALTINPQFDLALVFRGALHEWAGDRDRATADFFAYTNVLDASVTSAGQLALNVPSTVTLDTRVLYTFTFEGSAGETVQITAQSPVEQADPVLVVLGPDGQTPVAGSDDAAPNITDALISNLALPTSGEYTVLVTHSDSNTTGPVVVTLTAP
ncbi:MAG: tetratricopeptide repeat protein [Anaerolineae bacterium]